MPRIVSKEDSEIMLSCEGRWFHQGQPFTHEKIIDFFHKHIRKDSAGEYYLHNSYDGKEEHVYFEVEDTAYFVWGLDFDDAKKEFSVRLNTGIEEILDPHTLKEGDKGVMYCTVLDNDRARFSKKALDELVDHLETDDGGVYLDKTGEKIYVDK